MLKCIVFDWMLEIMVMLSISAAVFSFLSVVASFKYYLALASSLPPIKLTRVSLNSYVMRFVIYGQKICHIWAKDFVRYGHAPPINDKTRQTPKKR